MMTLADIKNLITVAQGEGFESDIALTDILIEVMDHHMDRHLAKYVNKDTVGGMDADDIRQIFLINVSSAIRIADINIGNPLLFILQKGKWAVIDELRRGYRQAIRQYCHECGSETRIHEIGGQVICPKCQSSKKVERMVVNSLDDGTVLNYVVDESMDIDEMLGSEMIVERFRQSLSGRKREVFELVMYEGYDRDSCKNYIKEVAEVMGVTPTNVNLRLRQIKEAWIEYTVAQPV